MILYVKNCCYLFYVIFLLDIDLKCLNCRRLFQFNSVFILSRSLPLSFLYFKQTVKRPSKLPPEKYRVYSFGQNSVLIKTVYCLATLLVKATLSDTRKAIVVSCETREIKVPVDIYYMESPHIYCLSKHCRRYRQPQKLSVWSRLG